MDREEIRSCILTATGLDPEDLIVYKVMKGPLMPAAERNYCGGITEAVVRGPSSCQIYAWHDGDVYLRKINPDILPERWDWGHWDRAWANDAGLFWSRLRRRDPLAEA